MSNSNIGTVDEAETAVLLYMTDADNSEYPEGWSYLGSGVQRIAFSAPSGYVYKVPYAGCEDANRAEAEAARVLASEVSDEFGVPQTNLIQVENTPVVVMENCGNERYYLDGEQQERAVRFFRNNDLHGGNVRWFQGKAVQIDLGFYNPEKYGPKTMPSPPQPRCWCGNIGCSL